MKKRKEPRATNPGTTTNRRERGSAGKAEEDRGETCRNWLSGVQWGTWIITDEKTFLLLMHTPILRYSKLLRALLQFDTQCN